MTFIGPKISVVTVSYNPGSDIIDTIESVINQTYHDIEYIVIDGKSTDNTIEILHNYAEFIDKLIIEEDKGVYFAMNKAIDLATGEWILFLNCGDTFSQSDIVEKIFLNQQYTDYDFIYGDYIWKENDSLRYYKARPLNKMWKRTSFCHQSLFTRTEVMKNRKFNTRYKIVSDYDFYFSAYMDGYSFFKIDKSISTFKSGGLSDNNFLRCTFERWRVVKQYRKDIRFHKYYFILISSFFLNQIFRKKWIAKIIPRFLQ